MTTITAHPSHSTGLFGRFGTLVSQFVAAIGEAREMADRYEHLSRLSDADLARLGLTREEIPQAIAAGR
ncbi:DUF1127 domain-containing protein [Aquabacter spiritensis]|uniref:Uncharacterized protein DUF1127 n=1 Tax=Aquabacter spiritensis TaxID=933073 RepID=A0A4R3LYG6_9HYPH|nr:DUF1127 domain-containing protein [Aquabacter spiritensis]TCT05692.1 uncharacterized protein DUF1127 [Aquabacter spiritensis]